MLEATDNNKINPLENIGAITLFNSFDTRNFYKLANEIHQTEKIISHARLH